MRDVIRMNDKKAVQIACQGAATISIEKVEPFQGELKSLSAENYERLKKSILDLGFSFPLHIWRNKGHHYCVDGHQRDRVLLKMQEEGYSIPPIPVVWVEAKSEKEAKLKILAATSQYGTIETDGLYQFMAEANIAMPDLESAFSFPEIDFKQFSDEFFTDPASDKDDEVPATRETDIKLGDMFVLGSHKLLCGDATKSQDAAKLMGKEKADMVFTDPPYGVSYADKNKMLNDYDKGNRIQKEIEADHKSEEEIKEFWRKSFEVIRDNLAPVNAYYIFGPQIQGMMMMMMMMMMSGLPYRHVLIWVKNNHVLGRCDYNYRHEPIFFGWTTKHKFYGNGKFQTSVWEVDKPLKNDLHPTMKPIEIIVNALMNSSKIGDICLDPFCGSGSTLIACEKTKRKCRALEISPEYCQVIIDRWQEFTGRKAKKCDQKQ
jgi:DNA modification methylase